MNLNYYEYPTVLDETYSGGKEISIYSKLLSERKIFVCGQIDDKTAHIITCQILYLNSISKEPITMYIDSPGGSVTSGLVIYDIMKKSVSPVATVCVGSAYSMAAVLLSSGTKGMRYILPHSRTMIHQVQINGGLSGPTSRVLQETDAILEREKTLMKILSDNTGKKVKKITKDCENDLFHSAQEAIDYGLCDSIINEI